MRCTCTCSRQLAQRHMRLSTHTYPTPNHNLYLDLLPHLQPPACPARRAPLPRPHARLRSCRPGAALRGSPPPAPRRTARPPPPAAAQPPLRCGLSVPMLLAEACKNIMPAKAQTPSPYVLQHAENSPAAAQGALCVSRFDLRLLLPPLPMRGCLSNFLISAAVSHSACCGSRQACRYHMSERSWHVGRRTQELEQLGA